MILVNRNFGNPALSTAIGDMFKPTSDEQDIGTCSHNNVLATGSSLVSSLSSVIQLNVRYSDAGTGSAQVNSITNAFKSGITEIPKNFFIVTEKFIKTLDKVYTKIWNESFTETGIYNPTALATLYNGFVTDTSLGNDSKIITISIGDLWTTPEPKTNIMIFKKFVDRCITAGILQEEDRLQYEDQVLINDLNKTNLSTQSDLESKLITFTSAQPMDIQPDINAREGHYLYGKKLFLMMTPYLTNESVIKNTRTSKEGTLANIAWSTSLANDKVKQEPIISLYGRYNLNSNEGVTWVAKQPLAFFKPKTPESKFGRSLPLSTHFFWRIGTPEEREIALLEGKTGIDLPELIFDHTDRISHIDSFTLKIKFDKLQF